MMIWMMGFVIALGLFVVVPIVAIISENRRKQPQAPPLPQGASPDVQRRLERMEAIVAAQQKQIEDLKEVVHVNILKMEDLSGLQQRIGPPQG